MTAVHHRNFNTTINGTYLPFATNPLDAIPGLQYFFVTCLAFQSVLGSIGNILVMGAITIVPALRTTGNAFLVNLSLADLFVTSVTQPGNILGALLGERWFQERKILCARTLCSTGCLSSCWNICMIAVNRFVLICYYEYYDRIYTRLNTFLICLSVWVLIYGFNLPNHVGWGDTRFSVVFFVCTFANHVHSYALFFICVGVGIPITISALCYMLIYLRVKDSNLVRAQILSRGGETAGRAIPGAKRLSRKTLNQNLKIVRALFRVYVIFLMMWLPVAVVIVLGKGTNVHYVWYILTVLLAHGNSSINCVVYAASLEQFREGYCRILGIKYQKQKKGNGTETSGATGTSGEKPTTKQTTGVELRSSDEKDI